MAEILDLAQSAMMADVDVASGMKLKASKAKSENRAKRGPKTKPKKGSTNKTRRGPGRPPKGANTFTYTTQNGEKHELGDWDQLMIKSIHEAKQPLINAELLDIAMQSPLGKKIGKDESRLMISRTIHKLVNRKNILKKVDHIGRGNAYATEGMLNTDGKVKKEFKRK
jgi:hypothetical protein